MMTTLSILGTVPFGLLAWVLLRRYVKSDLSESSLIAFIFGGLFVALGLSGSLAEFSGFGLSVKMRQASAIPVSELTKPIKYTATDGTAYISDENILRRDAMMEACNEYIVIRAESDGNIYSDAAVAYLAYKIRTSLLCGKFLGLIVLDDKKHFVGSFEARFFNEAVAMWTIGATLSIVNGDENAITSPAPPSAEFLGKQIQYRTIFGAALKHPAARISAGEGNRIQIHKLMKIKDALPILSEKQVQFAAVVDETGAFIGVVSRDELRDAALDAFMKAAAP